MKSMKQPCVYLLASRRNGTLYIGVTSDLLRRVQMETAIAREKALKEWKRSWKIELIEAGNPRWVDLFPGLA
ncbi:MAG: GIY-YIG nuclease family protein [Lysobacteraceae bacterium]|nr:MAG: GIY-YIG nuclease family protein [Xanthomonadaceae bacterium]